MPTPQDFIDAGFNVIDCNASENALLGFLRTHYPQVIKDGEINLAELKNALGMPIDEKVNGYGLNFIGRNVAIAKYKQATQKVLKLDAKHSKNADSTGNFIFRGDNLDCLKILKHFYRGHIKVIYIDPPYNTDSDEFIYPDKFDKEEAEVLGLANLSESDMERLEFSFGSKKSHNGWLSFIYPRLCLARDLLAKDGVIFISIDDNEQANMKLICDEIFGEGNFLECFPRVTKKGGKSSDDTAKNHDYILAYSKRKDLVDLIGIAHNDSGYCNKDEHFAERGYYKANQTLDYDSLGYVKTLDYPIAIDGETFFAGGDKDMYEKRQKEMPAKAAYGWRWRWSKTLFEFGFNNGFIEVHHGGKRPRVYTKSYQKVTIKKVGGQYQVVEFDRTKPLSTLEFTDNQYSNDNAKKAFEAVIEKGIFEYTKHPELVSQLLRLVNESDFYILDFFAGSGTTAQAVMQLNAEDGGNRRFILCQIDEPIDEKKKKTAYQFCKENRLDPVISSITIERVNRAGDKIKEQVKLVGNGLDIGYKVLELTDSPHLSMLNGGQLDIIDNKKLTTQDRITNLIYEVGVDDPAIAPEEIVKDSLYRCGKNYYVTHSVKLDNKENRVALKEALQKGENVYVDGWTATLNTTLQACRNNDVLKIIFFGFSRKQ